MPAPRPPAALPRHQDPYTRYGVHVAPFARAGMSAFAIHECGYLPSGVHTRMEHGHLRTDWCFPAVRSPYWRLYHTHDRGSFVRYLHRKISLDPDHIVIIPEDVLFDCVGETGISHMWLHFSPLHHPAPPFAEPVAIPMTAGLSAAVSDLVAAHRTPGTGPGLQRLYHSAAALLHGSFARLPMPLARAYPPMPIPTMRVTSSVLPE